MPGQVLENVDSLIVNAVSYCTYSNVTCRSNNSGSLFIALGVTSNVQFHIPRII